MVKATKAKLHVRLVVDSAGHQIFSRKRNISLNRFSLLIYGARLGTFVHERSSFCSSAFYVNILNEFFVGLVPFCFIYFCHLFCVCVCYIQAGTGVGH